MTMQCTCVERSPPGGWGGGGGGKVSARVAETNVVSLFRPPVAFFVDNRDVCPVFADGLQVSGARLLGGKR